MEIPDRIRKLEDRPDWLRAILATNQASEGWGWGGDASERGAQRGPTYCFGGHKLVRLSALLVLHVVLGRPLCEVCALRAFWLGGSVGGRGAGGLQAVNCGCWNQCRLEGRSRESAASPQAHAEKHGHVMVIRAHPTEPQLFDWMIKDWESF